MDLCWDCGKRLKNPIRKYCAKCWDRRMVEQTKKIEDFKKELKK